MNTEFIHDKFSEPRRRETLALGFGALFTASSQNSYAAASAPMAAPQQVTLHPAASGAENRVQLQQAIDRAAEGAYLQLPVGEFALDAPIRVPSGRSITLAGCGTALTTLGTGDSRHEAAMIVIDGQAAQPCDHVTLQSLTLNAHGFATGLDARHCFPKLTIREFRILRAQHVGMILNECWGASLHDVEIDGDNVTDDAGIRLLNANAVCLYNPRIYNLKSAARATGLHATSAESLNIYGGNIENCPRSIHIQTNGVFGGPVEIKGVYFEPRAMQPWQEGVPNDHIFVEGEGPGVVLISGCLFQPGVQRVPIAYTAVRARSIASIVVQGCVWQKAKFKPGQGENFFIDADSSVDQVLDEGNYLVSTNLGSVYRIDPQVRHRSFNSQDRNRRPANIW